MEHKNYSGIYKGKKYRTRKKYSIREFSLIWWLRSALYVGMVYILIVLMASMQYI